MNIFRYVTNLSIVLSLNLATFKGYFITRFRQIDILFFHLHTSGMYTMQSLFSKHGNFCSPEVSDTIH